MILEDILLLLVFVVFGVMAIRYSAQIAKLLRGRDPVREARDRLRVAQANVEAAKLDRQASDLYDTLIDEKELEKRQ